jgi:hypothetical protein
VEGYALSNDAGRAKKRELNYISVLFKRITNKSQGRLAE